MSQDKNIKELDLCALETPLPGGLDTTGLIAYGYYWHTSRNFRILANSMIFCVFNFLCFGVFANQPTVHSKLAGGEPVAVAAGIGNR